MLLNYSIFYHFEFRFDMASKRMEKQKVEASKEESGSQVLPEFPLKWTPFHPSNSSYGEPELSLDKLSISTENDQQEDDEKQSSNREDVNKAMPRNKAPTTPTRMTLRPRKPPTYSKGKAAVEEEEAPKRSQKKGPIFPKFSISLTPEEIAADFRIFRQALQDDKDSKKQPKNVQRSTVNPVRIFICIYNIYNLLPFSFCTVCVVNYIYRSICLLAYM